ncbi:hypothetical protein HDU81_005210 [Chytriomyces hyalinus]|nr:hypothetical protein HDU81_005210 [Chytriomyces hyalinus]
MELIAADKRNNMDRFILPNGMSKAEAITRSKLTHTAKLILLQVEYNPFLKKPQSMLYSLDESEVQALKELPYVKKYHTNLPATPEETFQHLRLAHDDRWLYNFNQGSWLDSPQIPPERFKKATAFMERYATMERHRIHIAEFGFPDHETYWGRLSPKSRNFIKKLANSEWTSVYARNVFASEQEAVADFLKMERKPPARAFGKDHLRRSELQSSKRVKRRSEMKRACNACNK